MFESPEGWRWFWLATAVLLFVAEIAVAGSFFFLPFAIGAAAATVAAFLSDSVALGWAVFVGVSAAAYAGMWRLRRRLDDAPPAQVGAGRWEGRRGVVVREIPEHDVGSVRLDREEWRAESADGAAIPTGTHVLVTQVNGTRLLVVPLDLGQEG
jgi:membrane protein implicated in regulation of membrane protease activity